FEHAGTRGFLPTHGDGVHEGMTFSLTYSTQTRDRLTSCRVRLHIARHARRQDLARLPGARDARRLRLGPVRPRLPLPGRGLDRAGQDRPVRPGAHVRRAGPDGYRQRRPHVALVLRPARLHRGGQQGPHGALRPGRRREVLLVQLELPGRPPAARRSAAPPVTPTPDRRRKTTMPNITVQWYAGRTDQQKLEIVAAITDAMVKIGKTTADQVHVVFQDVEKSNWGVNGKLASDR